MGARGARHGIRISVFNWLNGYAPFTAGANILQWIGSIGLIGAIAHYWASRCHEPLCIRPGHVPVKGTTKKACKKHAERDGHTH